MEIKFFTPSGNGLFTRSDLEEGHWTQQEMTVSAVFPFDPEKVILHGQRLAFNDPATGSLEVFEIRKVVTREPDHYQQIQAESIVISELSDEHINNQEITDKTPAQALSTVLTGTLWSVGNVSVSNVSSCDIARGDVWQAINTISENWNCYITPRITLSGSGSIASRYLDITPAQGTFRGLRLSIDKNLIDSNVTYDDTEVLTALYGYGGSVQVPQETGDDKTEELTFKDVVWTASGGHPAKPLGQTYLEYPEKTAIYGRNGRPRYGYYQNGDIEDAEILLQKTWEALQKTCEPKINITGTCADLMRLGYTDQPLRLHDTVIVEIRQTGEKFFKEIICLDVDLLDPTNNRPEIGDYIPNIIYINRTTREEASGRGGGGGRGRTNKEVEDSKWWTDLQKNDKFIGMLIGYKDGEEYIKTGQICLAINEDESTGAWINADHVNISATQTAHMLAGELEYDAQGKLVIKNANGLYVDRDGAQFGVFDNGNLTGGVMVNKINGQQGTVLTLRANVIDIDGIVAALAAKSIGVGSLEVEGQTTFKNTVYGEATITAEDAIRSNTGFNVGGVDLNVADITISGNTMTITFVDGTTATFSKATSLSGTWSGNTYTVTASPQGNTDSVTCTYRFNASSGQYYIEGVYMKPGDSSWTPIPNTTTNYKLGLNSAGTQVEVQNLSGTQYPTTPTLAVSNIYSGSATLTRQTADPIGHVVSGSLYYYNSNSGQYVALGGAGTYWYYSTTNIGASKTVHYN